MFKSQYQMSSMNTLVCIEIRIKKITHEYTVRYSNHNPKNHPRIYRSIFKSKSQKSTMNIQVHVQIIITKTNYKYAGPSSTYNPKMSSTKILTCFPQICQSVIKTQCLISTTNIYIVGQCSNNNDKSKSKTEKIEN